MVQATLLAVCVLGFPAVASADPAEARSYLLWRAEVAFETCMQGDATRFEECSPFRYLLLGRHGQPLCTAKGCSLHALDLHRRWLPSALGEPPHRAVAPQEPEILEIAPPIVPKVIKLDAHGNVIQGVQ